MRIWRNRGDDKHTRDPRLDEIGRPKVVDPYGPAPAESKKHRSTSQPKLKATRVQRRKRKPEHDVVVYPPSRWRVMRQVDDPVLIDAGFKMSKREAKRFAYPRRENRWGRAHGRRPIVRKGWRW